MSQYHTTLGTIQPLIGHCHGSGRASAAVQLHRDAGFHQMKQHLHDDISGLQNGDRVMQQAAVLGCR